MGNQLLEYIRLLSDIKQSRHAILLKIQELFYDLNFNINAVMNAINDPTEPDTNRAFFIQMLGKIAQFQPNQRENAINFMKKFYKSFKPNDSELIAESILFFYFVIDRTYLLTFYFESKRLIALRTRFLFINEELPKHFTVPPEDTNGQRIISIDRLFENLITMADTTSFNQVKDFVSFCCKFPFINEIEFIAAWAGIKNSVFLKELISSRIFINDAQFIIYEPAERVKTDKFVFELEFQKKIYDAVCEHKEQLEKKQLFDRFVDSFLKMSDILNDTGICVVGFNGQQRLNCNAEQLLGGISESRQYLNSLVTAYQSGRTEPEKLIINGINIEAKTSPLFIEDKNIGHIVLLKDITESEINKMFSAHDFKNSFNSVITTFRLLKESEGLADDERKCLISGEKSIFKLKEQFEEIVSFRSDKLNIESGLDLCNILNRVAIAAGTVLSAKNIRLDFPQAGDTVELSGDEKKISRIFENIIGNAIKYSPQDTQIRLSVKTGNSSVAVFIEDEGLGIEDSFGDTIFKMGSRQQRDVNRVEGSGLGLAIVKKFVTMHGGTISFSKNPVKGTTFRVVLPYQPTEKQFTITN